MSADPARDYLSAIPTEQVIVWTHAADVCRDGGLYAAPVLGLKAYVGYVREVHPWGLVVTSAVYSWWWATRWDLIEWAGPRAAFP